MEDARLHDGSEPAAPADLLERLDALGIEHSTATHAPVFTVDEARRLRGDQPGGHSKNLFLRNKKGTMWLITCLEDRRIDLRALAGAVGAGRLSFASVRCRRASNLTVKWRLRPAWRTATSS